MKLFACFSLEFDCEINKSKMAKDFIRKAENDSLINSENCRFPLNEANDFLWGCRAQFASKLSLERSVRETTGRIKSWSISLHKSRQSWGLSAVPYAYESFLFDAEHFVVVQYNDEQLVLWFRSLIVWSEFRSENFLSASSCGNRLHMRRKVP